jgi:hypothetical protein
LHSVQSDHVGHGFAQMMQLGGPSRSVA